MMCWITAYEYIQKLLNVINTYHQEYPNPTIVVKQALEEINLDLTNAIFINSRKRNIDGQPSNKQ